MSDLRPENRIPFRGRIHLLVPFDVWRLRLPLTGMNIGRDGLSALMAATNDTMVDAFHVLSEYSIYELQLMGPPEDTENFVSPPPVRARLSRRNKSDAGLELHFSFEAQDALLLAFIEQLFADRAY